MIEIQVSCCFEKVCFSYLFNCMFEVVMYQVVCYYGIFVWSDEECVFVVVICVIFSVNDINNSLNNIVGISGEEGKMFVCCYCDILLIDEVVFWVVMDNVFVGFIDVGDVSWKVLVVQCFSLCFVVGILLYSWQLVSQGRIFIVYKGMLLVGKVFVVIVIYLFSDSVLLEVSQ